MSFSEMDVSQMADWIEEAQPTADEIVEILMQSPAGSREDVGNKLLAAEAEASGGDPRDDVVLGIAEALGRGSSHGPEGSEGVPGTAPQETTGGGSEEGGTQEGETPEPGGDGDQTPAPAPKPDPTPAATALATAQGVDLDEVTGTGSGGRVVEADVKKYLAESEQA
jgi:pyruvate/2-oxoglutarate dehydrogenase complex dihydrolipoamide acyltransferase (E2) component